jgi:hypothetical protein
MTIMTNLHKLHAAVVTERAKVQNPTWGPLLNTLAVAAVTGGIESLAWKTYMATFVDNADQLTRLTVEQPGEPEYLKQTRAYIVSNAICDVGTNTHTAKEVDPRVDDNLSAVVNGTADEFKHKQLKTIPEVNLVEGPGGGQ